MMSLTNKVLRYLYRNDTGDYLDLYAKFVDRDITKKRIDGIVKDLSEYVDEESVYENRGILVIGEDVPGNSLPLEKLNVRINQKGREKFESIWNESKILKINRKTALIAFVGVVVTALSILAPIYFSSKKNNKEVLPLVSLRINNKTVSEIRVFNLQDFYMWYPGSATHQIGRYKIISKEDKDVIKFKPGITAVSAKILDNTKYLQYYKSNEYELSFTIRYSGGLIFSDSVIPFNNESIAKYYLTIVIDR